MNAAHRATYLLDSIYTGLVEAYVMLTQTDQVKPFKNIEYPQTKLVDSDDDDGDMYLAYEEYGDEYDWETEKKGV